MLKTQNVERSMNVKSIKLLIYPLCKGEMVYGNNKKTHIWVCEECPAVIFEYWTNEDIENLAGHIQ